MTEHADWPELPPSEWAPTRNTLHMVAQMLGKAKLALAPPQPEWLHVPLFLDPQGLVTGPIPCGARTVAMGIDVFAGRLWLASSDRRQAAIALGRDRTIAAVWGDFRDGLARLGLELDLWEKPQEVADTTPFSQNTRDGAFVPEHAQRFHRVLSSINGVFEEFRSRFFGRSGVSSGGAPSTSPCSCSTAAERRPPRIAATSCGTTSTPST